MKKKIDGMNRERGRRKAAWRLSMAAGAAAGLLQVRQAIADTVQTWTGATNSTWDTTSADWSGASTTWTSSTSNDAVFNSTGAGAITVASGGISVGNIQFNANGYAVSGGTLTTGATQINVATGDTASIGSNLSDSSTLSLNLGNDGLGTATGTLNLSGGGSLARVDIYAGTTNVSAGTYALSSYLTTNGTVAYNQTGGSLTAASGAYFSNTGGNATVNISGGSFSSSAYSVVGEAGIASLTVSGSAAVTMPRIDIGDGGGAGSSITETGGSITISGITYIAIAGSGAILNVGGGTFTTGTLNFYTSGATVNLSGGTLNLSAEAQNSGTGTFNLNGGTLQAGASFTAPAAVNTVVQSGGAVVDTNSFNVTFAGALTAGTGSGGLTKLNGGILVLSASNSYAGPTTISGGTLQLGNGSTTGSLSTSSTITDNGVLAFDRSNAVAQGTDFTATAISGTGGISELGAGTVTLSSANTYSGPTLVSGGTLQAGIASATGSGAFGNNSAVTLANVSSTVLNITGFNTQIGSLVGGGSTGGNVTLGSATLTIGGDNTSPGTYAGVISGTGGAITKIGSGTLILSNTGNSYTGGTTISGGTLATGTSGNPLSSGNITIAGGTLQSNNGGDMVFATANIVLAPSTTSTIDFASTGGVQLSGGKITGSGNLILNSTNASTLDGSSERLYIQNASDFTGSLTINSGLIQSNSGVIGNNAAITINSPGIFEPFAAGGTATENIGSLSGNGTLYNSHGAETCVIGGLNTSTTFAGVISDLIAVAKVGSGALTLSGSNSYTGGTTVSAGTLWANNTAGSATGSAAVSVLSGGTLGGSGTIQNGTNAITINSGGILTAGSNSTTIGTLTTGAQTWDGGGKLLAQLAGSNSSGLVNITSTGTYGLTLSGVTSGSNAFTVTESGTAASLNPATAETWTLATFTGATGAITGYTGTLPTSGSPTVPVDSQFVLDTSTLATLFNGSEDATPVLDLTYVSGTEDELQISYAGAPEPGTAVLALIGVGPLLLRRRRRSSADMPLHREPSRVPFTETPQGR